MGQQSLEQRSGDPPIGRLSDMTDLTGRGRGQKPWVMKYGPATASDKPDVLSANKSTGQDDDDKMLDELQKQLGVSDKQLEDHEEELPEAA